MKIHNWGVITEPVEFNNSSNKAFVDTITESILKDCWTKFWK